jgi:hypothetical protein
MTPRQGNRPAHHRCCHPGKYILRIGCHLQQCEFRVCSHSARNKTRQDSALGYSAYKYVPTNQYYWRSRAGQLLFFQMETTFLLITVETTKDSETLSHPVLFENFLPQRFQAFALFQYTIQPVLQHVDHSSKPVSQCSTCRNVGKASISQ